MDERRSLETQPGVEPMPLRTRRGTPWWLQLLYSLIVIAIAFAAWGYFFPGARDILAARGIVLPGAAAPEAATQTAQGAAPGANPNGAPAAGSFRNGGGGNGGAGVQRNRTAVVVTAPVTSAVINNRLTAIGEGVAASAVTVTSAGSGTLMSLLVQPGDVVAANAVIGQLDSDSEQIALDRAVLAAKDTEAALARASSLQQSQSVSVVDLNAAQLAADQARLEQRNAQLALDRRQIISPIAGTVGLLQVTPGNLVGASTVVTTVEDSSQILVNFSVPERYAGGIAIGMPVSASAVAIPGKTFDGVVNAVDNRIDAASRTLQVQARIPNPDGAIRAGMSFSVTLTFPGETFAAVDPLSIQWSSDGAYVWKMVDGKVQKGMVQIVQRNSGGVLVTGDVALGDQVVTQGVLQLQDGAAVRLLDDPNPQSGQGQGGQGQGGQNARPAATQQ